MGSKKDIAEILVRRDNITYDEALDIIEECQDEVDEAMERGAGFDEVEDILESTLGLEMDYVWAFL